MRIPYHLLRASTYRSEPLLAAMAAIAIGMFVGTWVLGPLVTRNTEASAPQTREHAASFDDMRARPDPFPYRAATPAFDNSGPPNYAAVAKQRAQAAAGSGDLTEDTAAPQPGFSGRRRAYYPRYDRHSTIY